MTLNWLDRWFDRLSSGNPQVFRELKGRLKRRSIILATVGSLTFQLLLLLSFWSMLPTPRAVEDYAKQYNSYCTGDGVGRSFACVYDKFQNPLIDWQTWWWDIFQTLSWTLPGVLLVGGVYLLMSDLSKEERRGTLNFIRLSPQTSQNILLGKLLGVPAIPYLAIGLAVPLHLIAAKSASVPLLNLLSVYLLAAFACACAYCAALLFALMGFQGWMSAAAITVVYWSCCQVLQKIADWNLQWFHLDSGHYYDCGLLVALLALGIATYWLWQAANRRYRNPTATLLSKRQSYAMTLCFEVWLIGFVFRELTEHERPFNDLIVLGFFNLLWLVMLVAVITPQRQRLLDWARYRRERVVSAKKFWSRSLLNDLLWGEKSPALVAIGLNLLIALAVVIPWMLTWKKEEDLLRGLATILLGAMYALICATIAQLTMFMKSQKPIIWTAGAIAGTIILPPVVLAVLQIYPDKAPLAWLFSIRAFAVLEAGVSATMVFTAFLGHLAVLGTLTLRLTRQLQKAGESEMKALLAASKA
ncbi:MAG: hypothetical protein ACAF41_23265 [Leptolyngbya sp. BL-A-14]